MDQHVEKLIADVISRGRLSPYLAASGGDRGVAIRLYAWNLEVSGAFLGPLQCFEVVLRNAMDSSLAAHFGQRTWWDSRQIRLDGRSLAKIREASAPSPQCPAPVADDVVAALSLGFWSSLLARRNNYETHLWRPALRRAFPGHSGGPGPLHGDVFHIRLLRNRIAHCEPIHQRHLAADMRTLLELVRKISPEASQCVERFSRVQEVLDRKAGVLDGTLLPRI